MAVAPLQIPGYSGSSSIDLATPLAALGQQYKQAQQDAIRRDTLAQLGQGTGQIDPRALLASGDMSLANLGLTIQNQNATNTRDARDFAFRQAEAERAQKNADRSYGLQAKAAARADEDKFAIKEITNPDGTTTLVRVKTTGGEGPINLGMSQPAADSGNPFGGGKFNEGQGKAAGFTDRMLQSESILSGKAPETGIGPPTPGADTQGANTTQYAIENAPYVPDVAKNALRSKDYQQFDQAKRDFINAQLRRESGAAISPSEFDSANKQYFPMPGDSPEVIAQKRANRRTAVEAMGREGGQSYRPKYDFNSEGNVRSRKPNIAPGSITQDQYNQLPSGSTFIAPDGSQRIKP